MQRAQTAGFLVEGEYPSHRNVPEAGPLKGALHDLHRHGLGSKPNSRRFIRTATASAPSPRRIRSHRSSLDVVVAIPADLDRPCGAWRIGHALMGHIRGALGQVSLLVHRRPLRQTFRMSFLTDFGAWRERRGLERAAHAEERAFVSDYQRQPKNRPSQILLTLAIGATIVGGSFAGAGSRLGLYLVVPCLLATVLIARWCLKNWDY